MQFIHYSRLQTYHQLIGVYDLYDKYKFSNAKFTQLNSINAFQQFSKFSGEKLDLVLFQELLLQKRFSINKITKPKLKNVRLTLRKLHLFNCLELLINSYFLRNKPSPFLFNFNSYVNLILDFTYNSEFFNHFNLKKHLSKYNLTLNFEEKTSSLNLFLSYYFIKGKN